MVLEHCPRCGSTPLSSQNGVEWTCHACLSVWDVFGRAKKFNGKGGVLRILAGQNIIEERGIFGPPVALTFRLSGWHYAWLILCGGLWMRVEVAWVEKPQHEGFF